MELPVLILLVVFLAGVPSTPVPEVTEEVDAEDLRQSAVNNHEYVNPLDLAELRERAIANASRCVSNTSLADLQNDNDTHQMQIRYRERKRQERLLTIQTQILQRLRLSQQPNISASGFTEDEHRRIESFLQRIHQFDGLQASSPAFGHRQHSRRHWQEMDRQLRLTPSRSLHNMNTILQRFQSFYPSCALPNNTDQQSWELQGPFRVYYDFPSRRYWLNGDMTVLVAKLRLYKFANNPNTLETLNSNSLNALTRSSTTASITVSIYQYLRPLRRNKRERKRLVDTKTLAVDYGGWVEFDVVSSVNVWLYNRNRNFGLVVEVEDENGNKIDPSLHFRNRNCSVVEIAREPPFPNIVELHPEIAMGENESSVFDNETYPTLDLQTAEVNQVEDVVDFSVYRDESSSLTTESIAEESGRSRRSARKMKPESQEAQCVEEKAFITFEELEMDNMILSPKGFEWTFCSGTCLLPNKASIPRQEPAKPNFLNKLGFIWNLLIGKPRQSECSEVDLRPLTIVYTDGSSNDPLFATLKDFIPTRCSCGL